MGQAPQDTSPPESSGGDDARALYDELTDDLLYDPAIGRATMMGYPCVRLACRFVASYDNKAGSLVVKLPRERVTQLIGRGDGDPFAPAGSPPSVLAEPAVFLLAHGAVGSDGSASGEDDGHRIVSK